MRTPSQFPLPPALPKALPIEDAAPYPEECAEVAQFAVYFHGATGDFACLELQVRPRPGFRLACLSYTP